MLLVVGCRLLVACCSLLLVRCALRVARCRLFVACCSLLDDCCLLLVVCSWLFEVVFVFVGCFWLSLLDVCRMVCCVFFPVLIACCFVASVNFVFKS